MFAITATFLFNALAGQPLPTTVSPPPAAAPTTAVNPVVLPAPEAQPHGHDQATPTLAPANPSAPSSEAAVPSTNPAPSTAATPLQSPNAAGSTPAATSAANPPAIPSVNEGSQVSAAAKPAFTVTGAPGKGLTLQAADDSYALTLRARTQIRETFGFGPKRTNEINIRTIRFFAQGHVFNPNVRYLVQLAFGPGEFDTTSPSPIFDAFVEYTQVRDLHIKVGQYFVPFDRARTIREFALQLVDRQQAVSELNLDRDVGISIYSPDFLGWGGRLYYALGVFGGDGRNRVGAFKPGFLYTARLALRPFGAFDDDMEGDIKREKKPRLAIGVAGAYNDNSDRQRSTIGKVLTTGTFDYTHAAADVVFKWRGLSVLGEALYRKANRDQRTGQVDEVSVTEYSRSGWGYLAQAGFMVLPKLEVAARWDQTFALGNTDPALKDLVAKQGHELGGGLNWYINSHFFKIQADYSVRFDKFNDQAAHVARLQIDATF